MNKIIATKLLEDNGSKEGKEYAGFLDICEDLAGGKKILTTIFPEEFWENAIVLKNITCSPSDKGQGLFEWVLSKNIQATDLYSETKKRAEKKTT